MSFLSKLFKNVDVTINFGGQVPVPPPPPPPVPLTLSQRVDRTLMMPPGFERDGRLQQQVTQALNVKDFALATRAAGGESGWMRDGDLARVTDAALAAGNVGAAAQAAQAIANEYSRNDLLIRVADAALTRGDLGLAANLLNGAALNPYARPSGLDKVQGKLALAFVARGQLGQAINVAKGMWDVGQQADVLSQVCYAALDRKQYGVAQAAIREVRDPHQRGKLQRTYQARLPVPPPTRPAQPNVEIDLGSHVTITFG